MSELEGLRRDYRVGLLRYLPRRDEAALHSGYAIGRSAVDAGISMLDLAQVHHEVFLSILHESPGTDLQPIVTAASEFFVEVLATYDMAQRGFMAGSSRADPAGSLAPRHGA